MNIAAKIDLVISEQEVARIISVSISTLRRLKTRGEGPPRIQVSRRRIGYRLNDVDRWLGQKTETNAPSSLDLRQVGAR